MPIAIIDWEYAGPLDPLVELARVCWLFPQLHDDDVAQRVGLPPLETRIRQLRLLVDAYCLSKAQRQGLFDLIVEVAVSETAQEAIEANITPSSQGLLWGLAWRARAAAWMLRHRSSIERAIA
jgi:aminoglycoside phosphotransferase (APT) family kinase protein